MKSQHNHNLHIPVPHALFKELKSEAERNQLSITQIVREAIDMWTKHQKAIELENALKEYIKAQAGTQYDLDEDLENASIDFLKQSNSIRKRKK